MISGEASIGLCRGGQGRFFPAAGQSAFFPRPGSLTFQECRADNSHSGDKIKRSLAGLFTLSIIYAPFICDHSPKIYTLQKGKATHSKILAWRILGLYIVHGGRKEVDMTERLSFSRSQFSSVAQSGPTLCDPMDCNTPGLPVHHQLPEFTQTHVH